MIMAVIASVPKAFSEPSAEMPRLSRKLTVIKFCVCGCGNIKEQCKETPTLWT